MILNISLAVAAAIALAACASNMSAPPMASGHGTAARPAPSTVAR